MLQTLIEYRCDLIAFLKFCGNFAQRYENIRSYEGCDLIAFLKFCGNFAQQQIRRWYGYGCDLIAFLKFCGNFAHQKRIIGIPIVVI